MTRCIHPFLIAAAIAGVAGASACTSTETSSTLLTSPSASKCQFDVSGSPSAFPAGGGQGSLTISTTRECAWTVAASTNWVSIGSRNGQGEATVSYSVAANAIPSARSAVLSVESARVELKQDAAPCRYAISPRDRQIGYAGGAISVSVETLTGCSWTTSSSTSWLTVTGSASGNASGTVTLMAAANTGSERSGRATIAGETLSVVQDAMPPPAPVPPPSPGPTPPPDPTPVPPPAPPQPEPPKPVDIKGTVVFVLGVCPDVALRVASATVIARGSTDYDRGSCSDLRSGAEVEVRARPRSDGNFDAERIKFEKKRDDD
jgi:hypothetical protein